MSLFKNLKSEGLEESKDVLGGGGFTRETDIYNFKIKVAYAGASDKGAQFIQLVLDDGKEYRETVYITNKKGENFYMAKDKDGKESGKKAPLPGFTLIDDICQIVASKPLCEMDTEEKVVQVYDFDAKKDLPKAVQVLTDLTGGSISLAIQKSIEDKKKKEGNDYVPTGETRDVNNAEKAFDTESKYTVNEARQELEAPVFWDAWLEKNKGKTKDKTDKSGGKQGAPGAAGAPKGSAPVNGEAPARKSLFGKK